MARIRLDYKPKALRWPAGDRFTIRFFYETHNQDAYTRVLRAIEAALADPPPPKPKQDAMGFHAE